jgi:GNAT superfamily N-acetyltransferase
MYHLSDHSFFAQTYGQQYDLLPGRQAYLYDANDHAVGTLTAWFETLGEKQFGKINWMLLVPEAQGKGLSKPLLSVICRRLLELGHQKALLYTLTARVPAVNLYRLFGFVPLIRSEQDYQAWVEVNPQLRRPFSVNEFIELKAFLE